MAIESRDGLLLIEGPLGGVAIRSVASEGKTPIAAVRGVDKQWIPVDSATGGAIAAYTVHVERRGPVAAAVRAETRFSDGASWVLRATVQAGDAGILIEERWDRSPHAVTSYTLAPASRLDSFTYRIGAGARVGFATTERVTDDRSPLTFEIVPWLHWWLKERRGVVVAASGNSDQAITLAALHADRWVAPDATKTPPPSAPIVASLSDGALSLRLPAEGVARDWLIAVTPKDAAIDGTSLGKRKAQPAQGFVIRNSDFPLDRLKTIAAEASAARIGTGPRLILTQDDIGELAGARPVEPKRRDQLLRAPLTEFTLPDHVDILLRTRDRDIQARLTAAAPGAMQAAVDTFLAEDEQATLGFAPHHRRDLFYAVHLADFALADPATEPAVASRLRMQAAFLADTLSRPDFWSPERGFSANPNMTSVVAGGQGLLACLLHGHPRSSAWLDRSLAELYGSELLTWSDDKGGWLEAPHYAVMSYDYMLAVFLCARNAGRQQPLLDPRMKAVARWLAQITTPPDSRIANARRMPAIGNTFMLEPTGLFGTAAFVWRRIDPAFAAEMQWMHQASGAPDTNGVGGWCPAMAPYQTAFKRLNLPARKPAYESALFPETGAILRTHPGSRETQAYLIAGRNHAHYDYDSGSITIWGKGELFSDDFGYYGRAPSSDHSMVESKATGGTMKVTDFSSQPLLDYIRGVDGPWSRQIMFVKDRDPLGSNYFVLRDVLAENGAGASGIWRLWLTARRIDLSQNRAIVVGKGDVDMDVVFLTGPPDGLSTEEATRISGSSAFANKPYSTTQTALRASMRPGSAIAVLLFPRLKTDPPPAVTAIDGGLAARIEWRGRTDTIFLGQQNASDGTFHGVAGAALDRDRELTLALGAAGRLSAANRTLESATAGARTWPSSTEIR